MLGKVGQGQFGQLSLFAGVDSVGQSSKPVGSSAFHFHEDDRISVLRNEIQLPFAYSDIPFQNTVSLLSKAVLRQSLRESAKVFG